MNRSERRATAAALSPPGSALWLGAAALAFLAAAALLARGQFVPAIVLAAALFAAVTALAYPQAHHVVCAVAVGALPLVAAAAALQPTDHDYTLYVALYALLLVVVGLLRPHALPWTLGLAYLSYILAVGLVTVLTPSRDLRVGSAATLLLALCAYILVHRCSPRVRRVWLGVILALAAVESCIGVAQALTGRPVFPTVLETLARSDRNYFAAIFSNLSPTVTQASGTFEHFNGLGALLVLATPIAFSLWLGRPRSAPRVLLVALLVAGTVATFSRGALLGTAAGVALTLFCDRDHSRRVFTVLVACLAGIALLLAVSTFTQYYQTTENVGIRTSTWSYAAETALDRPSSLLLGSGYQYYHTSVLSGGRAAGKTLAADSTIMSSLHSGPLQLLLEFGVVGVILFVAWLAAVLRSALGASRTALSIGLAAGAVGFLCHQFLDTSLFAYQGVLMVVVLALAEAEVAAAREAEAVARKEPES